MYYEYKVVTYKIRLFLFYLLYYWKKVFCNNMVNIERFELIVSGLKGDALSSLVSIDDFPTKLLFILP